MRIIGILLPTVVIFMASSHAWGEAYNIGDRKQLFIDKKFIEAEQGIELRVNPPVKRGQVISGVKPWENGVVYGTATTVLEDQGKFRMWYIATPAARRPSDENSLTPWALNGLGVIRLCYAESTDGIHWVKPSLGLYEWEGSKANNILMDAVVELGAGVFIDPRASADQRYKLVGRLHQKSKQWPYGNAPAGPGMYLYTSADGLRWRLNPVRLLPFSPDTTNMALYDDRTGKYLAYLRTWIGGRRRVGVIEIDNIMQPWPYEHGTAAPHKQMGQEFAPSSEIADAFGGDSMDPPNVDHYLPATVKYPWAADAYFMFPSAYRHFQDPPVGKHRNDGVLDAQMAVSRDGRIFHRLSRSPYIDLGLRGSKDCYRIYMGVGMLRCGDYIFQYYGGFDYTHGAAIARYLEDQGKSTGERLDQPDQAAVRNRGGVFAACQRLDGFVSVDAGNTGGQFATPIVTFKGNSLILNLNASATGEVRVELRDSDGKPLNGFSFADSDALYENDVSKLVTWRGGDPEVSQFSGKPLRIAFRLRTAKLYSFQFAP